MNKNLKIIIIIIAAVIVLAVAGFALYKYINKPGVEMPTQTLFKCHMGKTITDSDLTEIKDIINTVLSDKVIKVAKGAIPELRDPTNENGESIDVGDSITITLFVLTDDEKVKLFSELMDKYGITNNYIIEIKDIHKND